MLKPLALIAAAQLVAILFVVAYMVTNPAPKLPDVGYVPPNQHCWQEVNKEMPGNFEKICADNATFSLPVHGSQGEQRSRTELATPASVLR